MLTARLARLRLVCAPSCGGRGSLVASLGGASERLEGFESCRRLFVNYFRKEIQLSVRSVSAHQTLLVKDIRITVSDLLELDLELMCAELRIQLNRQPFLATYST
jgi:hypothetical protein